MSQENVERFHRVWDEVYRRRELSPRFLAEEVEWVNPEDAVEPGTRTGVGSFNEALRSIFDAWEDFRFEVHRVIDSGDEVLALGQISVRGRATGIEVAQPHGQIWEFRDGRVVRLRWFTSHREALEAVGLRE
jgi:ketosteroid isomerase-like protein